MFLGVRPSPLAIRLPDRLQARFRHDPAAALPQVIHGRER
jgi:hypothetical protein